MKIETKQYKMNCPADLMARLKEIAQRESRSVSAQVIRMLRQQVEADDAKP